MNQREKMTVIAGGLILAAVLGWRLLGGGDEAASASGSLTASIGRIEQVDRMRRTIDSLTREMKVTIPTRTPAEQEAAIRDDLAAKARACQLLLVSQKGAETSSRSSSKSSRSVQMRLDMYGPYDKFMQFIHALEHDPIPYVVCELGFDNAPIMPGQQKDQVKMPQMPPGVPQANGVVHATMRVQCFMLPPAPTPRPLAREITPTTATSHP